jgi:hypothetical protein
VVATNNAPVTDDASVRRRLSLVEFSLDSAMNQLHALRNRMEQPDAIEFTNNHGELVRLSRHKRQRRNAPAASDSARKERVRQIVKQLEENAVCVTAKNIKMLGGRTNRSEVKQYTD